MNRNTWILLGVAVVAFLVFVLLEGGGDGSPAGGGSGILGLFRGGGARPAGEVAGGSAASGAPGSAGPDEARPHAVSGAAPSRRAQKSRFRPGGPPDPELLKRIEAGGGGLVATGPARMDRPGMVRQSFRGGRQSTPGSDGTVIAGGNDGPRGQEPNDTGAEDPNQCGAPRVKKMVVDLRVRPEMRVAFDSPSQSSLMTNGAGERFSIGGQPAFVILLPNKNSSAGAIFDDQFLVLINGRCIPNREYMKSLLRR